VPKVSKSTQSVSTEMHHRATKRNRFRPGKYPERWAFSACWLTKTEQDVTKEKAGIQAGIQPKQLL
jgi:hypothetical protein